jgi:PAS domain S-box-containing protein
MLDLLQKQGLLSALLGGMQDGLAIVDVQGCHVFENEAMRRLTGFSAVELAGTSAPFPYWPPEELGTINAAFARTLSGEFTSYELVFMRKDGTRFWVIIAPSELRDSEGVLVGYFATIKDISDRKRLEAALQGSEQRWRSIAENPFDFVVVIDRDYRYSWVNHTAPGIPLESIIGKATPFDFVDAAYHQVMREAFQTTFETGRATSYDVYVPQLDRWYSSIVGSIAEDGVVTSISILTREITQQKHAEENLRRSEHQLREAHKLQSIGTLAGGIAHDLNNILTPILSYADMVQLSLDSKDPAQEYVDGIRTAGFRARDLVQRILLFGRRREAKKEVTNLVEHVREGLMLVKASAPANILISLELPVEPIFVLADPTQVHQVLTNLATNALHAMQDSGGRLTISVQTAQGRDEELDPKGSDILQDTYAQLVVRDTGPGMDADTQRRAFEPFFTTKQVGTGTGLGLSIVHGIVVEHGGQIVVSSRSGEGTAFVIRFPLAMADSKMVKPNVPAVAKTLVGPMRILCVDDEPTVLGVVRKTLKLKGHEVTEVTNAREALALFEKTPDAFDLLLTDQTMPYMLGTELVTAVRALRPSLPCVLMTGLGDIDLLQSSRQAGVNEVLPKPFSPGELYACVERELSRAGDVV